MKSKSLMNLSWIFLRQDTKLGHRWLSNLNFGSTDNTTGEIKENLKNQVKMPPEPTHCCNSGCANCVWIKYAQELAQLFDNGDVIARNKIKEKVKDPNLRMFLFTQLGLNEKQLS